ncbi:MAG: hypothetical protein L0323_23620 [Planctomycetes bacterium]|nr:hypothetical protein [Planctomycetota bacterium]
MASSDDLVLRPRRSEHPLLLCICSTFAALTFLPNIGESEAAMKWIARCGFGSGVLVFGLHLLPGASHLRLASDGIEVRTLYRSGFIRWSDVEGLFPIRMFGAAFVGMRFSRSCDRMKAVRRVASVLTGGAQGVLPDTYGRKVEDLAALLEDWRRRHSTAG